MDKHPAGNGDPGARLARRADFPWNELAGEVVVGIPASLIAGFCTLLLVSYLGPRFDVVIINDHVIGGTTDQVVVMAVGSVFGAAAVFCALRCWNRFGRWREERGASETLS